MRSPSHALRLLACLMLALMLAGCIVVQPFTTTQNRGEVAPETLREPDHFWTRDQVLMIPIAGTLSAGGGLLDIGREPDPLTQLKDRLMAAEANSDIRAVVLRIDSPGGSVTASDLMHREIVRWKRENEVPVIALMQGTAASGGLYVAMAADEVYALPTTITGSIGVVAQLPGIAGLGEKLGVEMRIIKSGENKDAGSMWRRLSEEQRAIFQSMIDEFQARFVEVILRSRAQAGLTRERLMPVADGRVLTATQALEAGLIDAIVYPDEAYDRATELAGLDDARVISYEYPYRYRGHVLAASPAVPATAGGDLNLIKIDAPGAAPATGGAHFLYLWMP